MNFLITKSYDDNNPMDGIFYTAFNHNIDVRNYISINASSNFAEQLTDRLWDYQIIEGIKHEHGWVSYDTPNQYINFSFLPLIAKISGYSFMSPYGNDENPRNWKVTCTRGSSENIIDTHTDDKTVCPNSNQAGIWCGKNEVHYFPLKGTYTCDQLRFTQTGLNSRNVNFFGLSAIEIFGSLYYGNGCLPQAQTENNFYLFLMMNLLQSITTIIII